MFMKVDDCIDDSDVGSDKMAMLPATRNVAGEPLEEGEGEEEEKEGEGGEEEPQDPDLVTIDDVLDFIGLGGSTKPSSSCFAAWRTSGSAWIPSSSPS